MSLTWPWGRHRFSATPSGWALYISLFPQLIAGPIVKYSTVADEIEGRRETWADFSSGCRLLWAWGKGALLNQLARGVRHRLGHAEARSSPPPFAWLGAPKYTCRSAMTSPATPIWPSVWGQLFGFHF